MKTSRFFLLLLLFCALQCLASEGYAQSPIPGYENFPVPIDEEHFPDENFRMRVEEFDSDNDGLISQDEISVVDVIDVSDRNIKSLEGIKYFFALGDLFCEKNPLESLDLVDCISLRYLYVGSCFSLKSLDISGCSSLRFVSANYCPFDFFKCDGCVSLEDLECAWGNGDLTNLDVSSCISLKSLLFDSFLIEELDVSSNPALEYLGCGYNRLTHLDVSSNSLLTGLECAGNRLEHIDLSSNPKLTRLDCSGQQLSELDISSNPELTMLNCSHNSLTELYLGSCPKLETLFCGSNDFVEFDASGCTSLMQLGIEENYDMTSLDVSGCTSLTILDIGSIPSLTRLDVSNCSALMELNCGVRGGHSLKHLNVNGCSSLTTLDCSRNKLTTLDVSGCKALTKLHCYSNALTELDLTANTDLVDLACGMNALTELNLSTNTDLVELACNNNNLSDLDVSKCAALTKLRCNDNRLRNLDLNTNTALSLLNCKSNALTELELGSNTVLQELYCDDNALTELDLTMNTDLRILACRYNALTELDLSMNTALEQLWCSGNYLSHLDLTRNESLLLIECVSNFRFVEVDSSYALNLNELPGFDISRAFGWHPEDVQDSIVHFVGNYSSAVYYYDSGRDTLQFQLVAETPIATDSISFPDSVFRDYVSKRFDADGDGFLSLSERDKVRTIDVSGMGIHDLQGIGCFSNLVELDCSDNFLSTLDFLDLCYDSVRFNDFLADLDCSGNHLTSLDLSYFSRLKYLRADSNSLYVAVDDERAFNLMQLPDFDLVKAYDWQGGYVEDSILHFEEEIVTYAYETGFNTVDSLPRFALQTKFPVAIEVDTVYFPDEAFRAYVAEHLDKSGDGVLNEEELNNVITLNVSGLGIRDLTGIGYFVGLAALDCSDNELTSLDLSANAKLQILKAEGNQLDIVLDENDSFGLSALPGFDLAKASDWTGCTQMGNRLTFTQQEVAYRYATGYSGSAEDENLQSVVFSLMADRDPSVAPERIVSIDEEHFPDSVFREYITAADLDADYWLDEDEIAGVTGLDVSGMGIQDLRGIEYFTALESLDCSDNELTSLDLSANTKLQSLNAENNRLDVVLDERNGFDVSTLPGFNMAKVSDWTGCTRMGNKLTFTQQEVTYAYATGYSGSAEDASLQSVFFSLMADRDPSVGNETSDLQPQGRVYAKDQIVYTEGISGEVSVYTTVGTLVYKGYATEIPVPASGVYIVRNSSQAWKILVM